MDPYFVTQLEVADRAVTLRNLEWQSSLQPETHASSMEADVDESQAPTPLHFPEMVVAVERSTEGVIMGLKSPSVSAGSIDLASDAPAFGLEGEDVVPHEAVVESQGGLFPIL
jgi:hypothetical protein